MREINVDKAWDVLHSQLGRDNLLPKNDVRMKTIPSNRWVAAAIILTFLGSTAVYWLAVQSNTSLLSLRNTDKEQILVSTLSDGSTVYLDKNATLSFPESFAADKRMVKMEGNVLFDVSKDLKRPFIIEAQHVFIEVIGTSFDVKSTDNETPFSLSVKTGKVKITQKGNGALVYVSPGETAFIGANQLQKKQTDDNQLFDHYIEKMSFKDEKLEQILKVIGNATSHSFVLQENKLANRKLTVAFENNSLNSMTKLICLALNLNYVAGQDTTYISQP